MHRFYLPPEQTRNSELSLTEGDAHHAIQVLRVRSGERVVVLDGAGQELLCEVRAVDRRRITLAVRQRNVSAALPYQLTLLQAIPKGKTMEAIVQKATELGAHRIIPILSERTVTQIADESDGASKANKWRATAIEAIKQCGSAWLPQVELPLSPGAFLARAEKFELMLIASLQPDSRHPREYLHNFHTELGRMPRSVCVWVGPEGDFTPAETHAVKSSGALPITLGPLILRSETAAIYCLSVLNYELQAART